MQNFVPSFKERKTGSLGDERWPGSRVLAALTEALSWVHLTQIGLLSLWGGFSPLFWPPCALNSYGYTHPQTYTNTCS